MRHVRAGIDVKNPDISPTKYLFIIRDAQRLIRPLGVDSGQSPGRLRTAAFSIAVTEQRGADRQESARTGRLSCLLLQVDY